MYLTYTNVHGIFSCFFNFQNFRQNTRFRTLRLSQILTLLVRFDLFSIHSIWMKFGMRLKDTNTHGLNSRTNSNLETHLPTLSVTLDLSQFYPLDMDKIWYTPYRHQYAWTLLGDFEFQFISTKILGFRI